MAKVVKASGDDDMEVSAALGETRVTPGALIFKLVLAGEGGVGKSSILLRYLRGGMEEMEMTVGTDFAYREIRVGEELVGLSIWDFGGEERFRELIPVFCRGAHGAILVFDLERYSTFLHLSDWASLIRETAGDIPLLLAGSKMDKSDGPDLRDVREFCRRHSIQDYLPVSARDGTNVDKLFTRAAELLLQAYREGRITPAQYLRLPSKEAEILLSGEEER